MKGCGIIKLVKRNLLLLLIFVLGVLVVVSGTRRLLTFRTTAAKVEESEKRLAKLREENEALERELEHKRSPEFVEREIREKLGLVKKGEAIVILPKDNRDQSPEARDQKEIPNWQKWWKLFFGS